ncbi:MAG: hypothetical protein EKK41_15435 [Hyphomicrobiales bacterium]|nr:MAG: hypothetical protein EKK41_15435 [Hyphomicrobiales bacterium]
MEALPHEPRNFRELVESDLRRAGRLLIKVQDAIDWQFRLATPKGDLHMSVTMGGYMEQNAMLERIALLMHWKQVGAFSMAAESRLPTGVYAVGLSKQERHNCFAHFNPLPKPWTARNFDRIKWLPEKHIEPRIAALLPASPRTMSPAEVSSLQEWFGPEGRFPAVHIESGELVKL